MKIDFEQFFLVSLDMFCIANNEGFFLRVNPAFTDTLGWSPEELMSKPYVEFVHPEDRVVTSEETAQISASTVIRDFENRYRHADGSWRTISWKSVGSPSGLIYATARDVTAQKEIEEQLRLARDEAQSANMAKSEFLSRMSHELRTPMNAVLGYAQLLDLNYADPKIQHASRAIIKGGKHLLELINEVLDLSRIESGNMGVVLEAVALDDIQDQAFTLVEPVALQADVALMRSSSLGGVYVKADRQRLLQIFVNLIGNAIKYNRRGGTVTLACSTVSDTVRIEISDTGHGILPQDQPLLFRPFQRFGDPGIEGSGLGLVVSERFMALMGGAIGLASSSSSGSTFFLELAREQAMAEPFAMQPHDRIMRKIGGTVLYIEDNQPNTELMEHILEDWEGVLLVCASTGAVGVELALRHTPYLILLDVHLPDMMGDKVLDFLKANSATTSIPVVMLSADATRRQIEASRELGAADYLTKPLDISRLFEVLETYLPPSEESQQG
jgi:PAS domain S-box-containing protein